MNNDNLSKTDIDREMKSQIDLPKSSEALLEIIKSTAIDIGITRLALVGGVVRDQLLSKYSQEPLPTFKDIDLIIEGSVYELANKLQSNLGSKRVKILRENNSYHTIEIKIDNTILDLATAREEVYAAPAENPKVSIAKLEEDLQRRDFSINAIAFDLINKELLDPHKGCDALIERQLDFLHPDSVAEDPTRIIRGARYSARLNLHLSLASVQQIRATLRAWPWSWRPEDEPIKVPPSLGVRLRMELELLLEKEPWEQALRNLQDWGGLLLLDKGIQDDHEWGNRVNWALKLKINPLTALITGAGNPSKVANRLQLPIQQQNLLSESLKLQKSLSKIYISKSYVGWSPSSWCHFIENGNWSPDVVALTICQRHPLWKPLFRWLKHWRLVKSPISAKELMQQGLKPGPLLKQELKRLRDDRLDSLY